MAVEFIRQVNFTGGELDPLVQRRRDIKAYFASSSALSDVLTHPQGPVGRRYGFAFVDRIRHPLAPVPLDAATITCPNGGDTTKLLSEADGLVATTVAMGVTDPYVVFEVDMAAPTKIGIIDVIDFAVVDPAAPAPPAAAPPTFSFFTWWLSLARSLLGG